MYCLASIGEANTGEGSLYRYLSSAISQTIIDSLDLYLDDIRLYDVFIQFAFPENFFEGLSRNVLPKAFCMDAGRIWVYFFQNEAYERKDAGSEQILYFWCLWREDSLFIMLLLGIKPPLLLLGTEEANRIANEEQQRRYIEKMNEYFGEGWSLDGYVRDSILDRVNIW